MSTKEAMDSVVSRRRASAPKAGSVWEIRMKLDQVKGGIKVFNANHQENPEIGNTSTSPVDSNDAKQSPAGSAKRKTWKSDGLDQGCPIQIGRQRSEVSKNLDEKFKETSDSADGNGKRSPVQIRKTRPVSVQLRKVRSDSAEEAGDENSGRFDKIPLGEKSRSEEELGVCQLEEQVSGNADNIKNKEEEEEEVEDEENGNKIEVGIEEKSLESKKTAIQEKKLLVGNQKSVPNSPIVKKQLPNAADHAKFPTKINPNSDSFHGIPRTRSKLQSFADLIMWRDVAKSSFIFGIGTFAIISSSYTNDLNISFISVVSYLGLAYLAVNFLFRSLVSRGSIDNNMVEDYVVGEDEAFWVIKLVLPYVNEFLLRLRALFSGDPATTMKLAVILFVLARCGSSITMWKMAKLGFIGVFTVPKVCSSYSAQINAYGRFWIQRLSDAWESCSHKKAVGFAVFSLVWNMSSLIARIWTVFMLYVAFKCYQHSSIREECEREEGTSAVKLRRQARDPNLLQAGKTKKVR